MKELAVWPRPRPIGQAVPELAETGRFNVNGQSTSPNDPLRARLNSVADRSLTASSAIHSSLTSSRRRPNKTESIDQQPGPSMAIATQTHMSRIPFLGSSRVIKIINASSSAARIPATGVHSPMSRSPPGIVEVSASKPGLRNPEVAIAVIPFVSKYSPDAIRSTSRPAPGHPFGKIENRRCKEVSLSVSTLQAN